MRLCLMLWCLALPVWADKLHPGSLESPAFIAQIEAHTPSEVFDILSRLEVLLQNGRSFPSNAPLALVLHGEEAGVFLRRNYHSNKALVDLAARLDAFDAVHIQICETWMRRASVSKSELPAFVETIPYGPSQEKALLAQGYEYF
jgi:intracellular sulfur oxidation DsrE/DsrF family protein